jgi:hypothetical protein
MIRAMIPPGFLKRAGEMVEEARRSGGLWWYVSDETISMVVWALAEDLQRAAEQTAPPTENKPTSFKRVISPVERPRSPSE